VRDRTYSTRFAQRDVGHISCTGCAEGRDEPDQLAAIDPALLSQAKPNWRKAAASAGFLEVDVGAEQIQCGSSTVPLPATPETVAAFVAQCRIEGRKPATVRRYPSTIALGHRVANLVNPCADEAVQLEINGLYNAFSARQRQAKALGWADIKRLLNTAGDSLPATRERALVCVAYDAMARRSELVALNLEDFDLLADGTGRALIRRSKTDQAGEGNTAYLSRTTVRYLKLWLDAAGIKEGAVFRRVIGRDSGGTPQRSWPYRRSAQCRCRRSGIQTRREVDQAAHGGGGAGKWSLDSGRGDPRPTGTQYRPGVGHA
jgi:site-specific recombinase XerC